MSLRSEWNSKQSNYLEKHLSSIDQYTSVSKWLLTKTESTWSEILNMTWLLHVSWVITSISQTQTCCCIGHKQQKSDLCLGFLLSHYHLYILSSDIANFTISQIKISKSLNHRHSMGLCAQNRYILTQRGNRKAQVFEIISVETRKKMSYAYITLQQWDNTEKMLAL